ncbi:MAG: NAD(P)/FAD-dependent oxidoreductase [Syntrophobacteraceae bacterium]
MDDFDVLVVGSGTGGQTAAIELNNAGLKVAVCEKSDRPGGTCALRGCQPKKWFYEATETVAKSRHLKGKGIVDPAVANWSEIRAQKDQFTSHVPENTIEAFNASGIRFLPGRASFLSPNTMEIDGKSIAARYYILATGARPMFLPIRGSEHIITSDELLELEALPENILFVGGGFISFEFAHFAARLGPENIRIRIFEATDRPLGPFDAEMVELLVEASKEEGIEVRTSVHIVSIDRSASGFMVVTGKGESLPADLVVHGAGRSPDIEELNLEAAAITKSARGITVDERMCTSNPNVFAVGDCAATIQLARVADFEGHVAARNILAALNKSKGETIHYEAVPSLLFTYPQYGMLGKTEAALLQQNTPYRKAFAKGLQWPTFRRVGLNHAAYKILVGADNRVLGAHILSDNASGLINTLKQAMLNGTTVEELYRQSIMSPYPTRESDLIYMLKPLV